MKRRRSTILLVIFGIVILIVVVGAGTATWLYLSTVDSIDADESTATQSLDEARARFTGQKPIVEIGADKKPILMRAVPEAAAARDLQNVHVLAWSPAEGRLTTVALPFWLIRMRNSVPISANGQEISLSADEVERYGPALFLDYVDEDGARILVWTD